MALTLFTSDRGPVRRSAPMFIGWGLTAMLLGVAILAWPRLTGQVLVSILGAAVLASGLALLYWSLRLRETHFLWMLPLVPGVTLTALGFVTLVAPSAVATFFVVIVALLAILAGIGDLALSVVWRQLTPFWWVRALRGVLLVGLGVALIATPLGGLAALGTLLGALAMAVGVLSIWLGTLARRV